MNDWTKGGRWSRVTVYRYGTDEDLIHLCLYDEVSFNLDPDQEIDVTHLVDSVDAMCMVHPFIIKEVFQNLMDIWCKDLSSYGDVSWVTVGEDGVECLRSWRGKL